MHERVDSLHVAVANLTYSARRQDGIHDRIAFTGGGLKWVLRIRTTVNPTRWELQHGSRLMMYETGLR